MGKIISIIAVMALIVVLLFVPKSCGSGNGDGEGTGTRTSISESETPESGSAETRQAIDIKIEQDKIYLDGELCKDANELKDLITNIGTEKEYNFIFDEALKGTYDEVDAALSELEDALDIVIIRDK